MQCDGETHAARVSVRVDRGQCRAPRRKSEGFWQVGLCSSCRGSTACCEVPCPERSRPWYFCVLRRAATRVAGCSEGNVAVGDEAIRFGKAPWQMHRKASKGCWGGGAFCSASRGTLQQVSFCALEGAAVVQLTACPSARGHAYDRRARGVPEGLLRWPLGPPLL